MTGRAHGRRDATPLQPHAGPPPIGASGPAWRVRRVLVAVDGSAASRAAAAAAAALATTLGAELRGVFVADRRLADLAVAGDVGSHSGIYRSFGGGGLAGRLRGQERLARRCFESCRPGSTAAASGVGPASDGRIRFQVIGCDPASDPAETLRARLGDGDLLALGRVGRTGHARLGGFARALLAAPRGSLLLVPPGGRLGAPVVVAYPGPDALPALTAAVRLAAFLPGVHPLTVVAPATARASALTHLASLAPDLPVVLHTPPEDDPYLFPAGAGPCLAVLPTTPDPLPTVEALSCPVLLIR